MTTTRGYFVTGTDTGIGKTLVASALLKRARHEGLVTLGIKPLAAGCNSTPAGLRNDDALALLAESSLPGLDYQSVNPLALTAPVAPHLAAESEGITVNLDALATHCRRLMERGPDFCVIEGAGGWLVPVDRQQTLADLASRLQLPVVMVVGMRLGCINHALLTAAAVQACGLPLAGWVASCLAPDMACLTGNIDSLRQRIDAPLLGTIPFLADATPGHAAAHLALPAWAHKA